MHIYAFSGIFRHNHTYSEIIQVYSDISRILCKLSIFRISVYSEPLNEPKAYSKSWSEPKPYSELCILITKGLVKQENIFRKKGYHLFSTLLTHSNVLFRRVYVYMCVFAVCRCLFGLTIYTISTSNFFVYHEILSLIEFNQHICDSCK